MTGDLMLDTQHLSNMERHVRQIIASDEDRLEKAKRALKNMDELPRGKQRVVKEQMKLVVGDLENVLGELKDVVGDLQVLVNQIDAVTNRIDEEYGVDFRNLEKRRKSTSAIENFTKAKSSGHCKSKSYHLMCLDHEWLKANAQTSYVQNQGEVTSPVWQLRSITSPVPSAKYESQYDFSNNFMSKSYNESHDDKLIAYCDRPILFDTEMLKSASSSQATRSSILSNISDRNETVMCRSSDTSGCVMSSKGDDATSNPDIGPVSYSDRNNNEHGEINSTTTHFRTTKAFGRPTEIVNEKTNYCVKMDSDTERLLRTADDILSDHDSLSLTSSCSRSRSGSLCDPHLHCAPVYSTSPDSDYCGVYEREFELKVELEYDDDLDNYYGIDECLSAELESFKECNIKYRDRNFNNDIWSNYLITKDIGDDTDLDEDPFMDSNGEMSSDLLNDNMAASSIPTSPSDFGDYVTWEKSESSDFNTTI